MIERLESNHGGLSARDAQLHTRSLPLSIAAYVTWAALGAEPVWRWLHGQIPLTWSSLFGAAGLVAVPILLALTNPRPRVGARPVLDYVWRFMEAPAALLACWGLNEPLLASLLVIAAAQMGAVFRLRTTFCLLLLADCVLLWVLSNHLDRLDVVVVLLGNCGFQAFAVLTISYTIRAQQARDEVLRINAELLATRQLLLEGARDEERLRISRELHDLVGHKLTALKLQLRLRARAPAGNPECRSLDDECMRLSDELLSDVRGVVSALRDGDGIDLHQALAALIPAVPQPHIELKLATNALVPGLQQAHVLLRCAQEGLTNALRHSGASSITLRLDRIRDGVALCVEDDGHARSLPRFGNGLAGMRERLQALGGTLDLAVNADHGLRVTAWLPQSETAGFNA